MSHVWICQCLCPQRHCITATAGVAVGEADAEIRVRAPLREAMFDLLADRAVNPWCGLCRARAADWQYELRRTVFASMKEAAPLLAQLQANQRVTNAVWGDMKRSD